MPSVVDAERVLPNARRRESRRAEGKPECLEAWTIFSTIAGNRIADFERQTVM